MKTRIFLALLCLAAGSALSAAEKPATGTKKPAVLIINAGDFAPMRYEDFDYLQRLNQHGFQIDTHFLGEQPLTWDLIKQYNCLVILDLPPDEKDTENWGPMTWGKVPPYKKEMLSLLDAYLAKGGGIFLMPDLQDRGFRGNTKFEEYLKRWGAQLPYESVQDPATITVHPRNTRSFVYTQNVAKSPVSEGGNRSHPGKQ